MLGVVIPPCACTAAAFRIRPRGCKAVSALIPPRLSALLGSVPCGWVRAGSEALVARNGCQNGSVFGLGVSVKHRRN